MRPKGVVNPDPEFIQCVLDAPRTADVYTIMNGDPKRQKDTNGDWRKCARHLSFISANSLSDYDDMQDGVIPSVYVTHVLTTLFNTSVMNRQDQEFKDWAFNAQSLNS